MKLLTLNTHSFGEENQKKKLITLADAICKYKPEIIALQEANQIVKSKNADDAQLKGLFSSECQIGLKSENYAVLLNQLLLNRGINYNWSWSAIKKCGEELDEGMALFSSLPIDETVVVTLSENDNYTNWRTRKALGMRIASTWFYTAHFGWWNDEEEPFIKQWNRMCEEVLDKDCAWVLGDLNSPASCKGEGYEYVKRTGWYDTYELAEMKDKGHTVQGSIAGWESNDEDKRIDYILCNQKHKILSSYVMFNGVNEAIVSDHFGIMIETEN